MAQTGGNTYALNNITANTTVQVTFMIAPVTYAVTPSAGANGSISPNTVQNVPSGGSIGFTANPSGGYVVNQWLVNGNLAQTGGTTYTLADVTAATAVQVTFMTAPVTYTVTPSAGANGSISPNSAQSIVSGSSVEFTATPANGYVVNQWLVNGAGVQNGGDTYTLNDVTANASVEVTFMLTPIPGEYFTISSSVVSSAAGQTTVTVSRNFTGAATVDYQTFDGTALANVDYSPTSGVLSFAANQMQQTIDVPILTDTSAATTEFSIALSNPGGGAAIGNPGTGTVVILNSTSGDLTLSQTNFVLPQPAPSAGASITVNLAPAGIGQWRLLGELDWRDSGDTATGLTSGNYVIEFKTEQGYQQPDSQTVPVPTGSSQVSTSGTYTVNGSPATGSLQVVLAPQGSGGWRIQGGTTWLASGATISNLNTGDYILEFEPVAGLATPADVEAVIYSNELATVNVTYFVADSTFGLTPALVSDTVAQTLSPYIYTGQIRTDEGAGSGFVPLDRIVVTAAHVLFDDVTLSYVTGVQWFFQYQRGQFEAPAQIPRGSFVLQGYAAQRAFDNSPGVSSTASQQVDAAALYFYAPTARGGQSGYLGSNAANNPWLTSGEDKFIAGYPVNGVSQPGCLYATPIIQDPFQFVTGSLFRTNAITSYPGNSGGPLFVRFNGRTFFPAGIYLGGSGETVVHAIDGPIVALMNQAEAAGNGGQNNGGGGIVDVNEGVSGVEALAVGSIGVTLQPAGAAAGGAYWGLEGFPTKYLSGTQATGLAPANYTVQFFTDGPGYTAPASTQVTVTAGNVTSVTGTYSPTAPTITSGTAAMGLEGQSFSYQITVTPNATGYSAAGALPPGLVLNGTTGLISGVLSSGTGVFPISLQARNDQGTGATPFTLVLTVETPGQLTVSINGQGSVSRGFASPTFPPVTSTVKIKATPKSGSVFAYWSNADNGEILSTDTTYSFPMPPVLDLQANFVTNPFQTAKGSYLALFQGGTYSQSGFAQMTVKENGEFTAAVNLGGAVGKLTGAFSNLGQSQSNLHLSDGRSFNVGLSLTAGGLLSGTMGDSTDGLQIPVNAECARPLGDEAVAGTYTVLFPATTGTGPGGNGYGTATVSKTGAVKFTGKLGDEVAVNLSGQLDGRGVWPFFYWKPATGTAGAELLLGSVAMSPAASGSVGILSWYREPNGGDKVYPYGFSTEISPVATQYTPPIPPGAAAVIFSGAGLPNQIVEAINIVPGGKVVPGGGNPFKLTLNSKTGLFTGSIQENGTSLPFTGALLESGSAGLGLFRDPSGGTGSVLIQASQ